LLPGTEALKQVGKLDLFSTRSGRDFGGFLIPESQPVVDCDDMMDAARNFGLPAVMKGAMSGCIALGHFSEASTAFEHLAGGSGEQALLQRRIEGAAYAVSVVCDRTHSVVSAVTIRKLATCSRGATWVARTSRQDELEDAFGALLKSIKWVGPAEGEFIRDPLTGRFYLIEINPRFTAWIFYTALLGHNQPSIAVRLALGLAVDMPAEPGSLIFMRTATEHRVEARRLAGLVAGRR